MAFWNTVGQFFGFSPLNTSSGILPTAPMTTEAKPIDPETALQVSAQYACVKLISSVVASLPLMVYESKGGKRSPVARDNRLWLVLHSQPNQLMTMYDFWNAMIPMYMLRGNAYAQILRDMRGQLVGLYPLVADNMRVEVDDNGDLHYLYTKKGNEVALKPDEVLHLKDMGTGLVGLAKTEYMSSSLNEARETQRFAVGNAANMGKAAGILTVDHIMKTEERAKIKDNLFNCRHGDGTLVVLEADMKFSQLTMTPEQMQLIENRKFTIEDICRWNGVPPILIGAPGATTWGTGISEIMSGFYKLTLAPLLKNFEQAMMSRVLTPEERQKYSIEFNLDALLRGDLKSRYEAYVLAFNNGWKTRNEIRQLENDEPVEGGDELTALENLVPLNRMGKERIKDGETK